MLDVSFYSFHFFAGQANMFVMFRAAILYCRREAEGRGQGGSLSF